ncbi:hypothetical protein TL16_g05125 [Triparma laevis f. inornata]|uniref:Uncharacterized protein n=2 Tax=Triparma laevis TaxID=1534972 RepID=A0A9W7FU83_9STRA|nr:hypothetical protein TL16_g05125 [Triparma laevis f. inornata]GMI18358.1 hypothetical protein TrLO_g7901 [Triparma laevis f. longispina]
MNTIQSIVFVPSCLFWLALLKFAMNSRSHIAELPDKDLSHFLTNDVIMGALIIGLGRLAFLLFASIQYDGKPKVDKDGNNGDWRLCNRTLISQTGLSGMISLYVIIKLLSGVVPEHILEKHVLSMKKVVAMKMNAEKSVQAFRLTIAICCALFSLGGYGANGNFGNNAEKFTAYTIPLFGMSCLLLTVVWKMVAIRGEIKRGEVSDQLRQGKSSSEVMLAEGSSFWFYLGVLATTFQVMLFIASAVTLDEGDFTQAAIALPIVVLLYLVSIGCQPRRNSPKDLMKMKLHFAK